MSITGDAQRTMIVKKDVIKVYLEKDHTVTLR